MIQKRIYDYFKRNPQLRVLFVFDTKTYIQSELEEVKEWAEGYVYKEFDGAWFNTKYAIEHEWKDKKVILFFPKAICPSREEEKLRFPLMDVLKANMEFKEDDYEAFMQQYHLPDEARGFIKRNVGEMMTNRVSAILKGKLDGSSFSEDLVCRSFLSAYLGESKLLDWETLLVKMIILDGIGDEKKRNDFWYKLSKNMDAREAVSTRLDRFFGISLDLNRPVRLKEIAESLKYNAITQQFEASPLDPYKRYKVTRSDALDFMNRILREGYQMGDRFSEAMATLSRDIKEDSLISVYGIDANYENLSEAMGWPILEEIVEKRLVPTPDETNERMRCLTEKLPGNSPIQSAIQFVRYAALYYTEVRGITTLKLNSVKEYVDFYVNAFYIVDMYYRLSMEAYHVLVTKDIPNAEYLYEAKIQMDKDYARITNLLNSEWLTCVEEKGAFLADTGLPKAEDFYKNESDQSVKQVIIVSDALRYEVAKELMQELAKEKHYATISAYQAMLPTETKYCKPALLPHESLELREADMLVDGSILSTIEQRTAHLRKYRKEAMAVRYEEVMSGDTKTTRELFKRPLVYVFHDAIDEASHSQNPFEVIGACRKAIQQLSILVKRLHASWNVTNVLIVADHGFLYNDMRFEEKDKHAVVEEALEKKTRYYLTKSEKVEEGILKFPLGKVSSIQSETPLMVATPIGTNRLAAPGGYNFTHGGASLQELIVPVIKSQQKRTDKTEKVGVALISHNLNMVSSRLKFKLIQSEAVSMTVTMREIVCGVYDGDLLVTDLKNVTLNSADSTNLNNRVYEVTLVLSKPISASMLQLRIYDVEDQLNPIVRETVKNISIIERDF